MRIAVERKVGMWYCYRVLRDGRKPLEEMHAKNKVLKVLMREMAGTWHFGKSFQTKPDIPPLPANPERDHFVLIWSEADRLKFEHLFDPLT